MILLYQGRFRFINFSLEEVQESHKLLYEGNSRLILWKFLLFRFIRNFTEFENMQSVLLRRRVLVE